MRSRVEQNIYLTPVAPEHTGKTTRERTFENCALPGLLNLSLTPASVCKRSCLHGSNPCVASCRGCSSSSRCELLPLLAKTLPGKDVQHEIYPGCTFGEGNCENPKHTVVSRDLNFSLSCSIAPGMQGLWLPLGHREGEGNCTQETERPLLGKMRQNYAPPALRTIGPSGRWLVKKQRLNIPRNR